jgi:prophage antirepressor-like protein
MKLQIATALMCLAFSSATFAQVSGSVNCTSPGKPDLKFQPQSAVGYFVKKSGAFSLAFFADKLNANEIRYWVASETAARDGKFEGKTHEDDATLEKRMAVFNGEI